ncbi:palmitoyltransferase ZDHHC11 isoform X6 [Macaca mulatta]
MSGAPVRPAHLLQGALLCDHGSLKVKKPHLPEARHRWELSRPAGRGVCDSEEAPGAVCSAWALTPRDPRADPRRPLTPGCSTKVPPWKLSAPLTSHQTCWLLNLGLPASRTGRNKFLFFKITASQMDTRSGSQCSVAPEAVLNNGDLVLPPRISRVNGWSLPLHYFQVVTWAVFLGLSSATFGIFIPLLPHVWKYIAYVVTGGIFFFHLIVHLIASCIDPADFNVRLMKNYSQPMPIFDRSKHAHVIQNQFCHLCKVTVNKKTKHCISCNKCVSGFDHHCKWINNCVGSRNYWFFFSTVASATAGMLCLITILLYILVQYFVDPGVLRTDPNYEDVKNTNTWLLFLPLFPVQVQTLIVVIIGMVVLLLDLLGLVQLGQLLIFHIYLKAKKLTTFEYLIKTRKEESSKHQAARKDPCTQMEEGFLQQGDGALGSSAQGDKAKNSLLTFKCLYHHSTPLPSDKSSSEQEADDEPSPSSLRAKVKSFLLIYKSPCHFCTSVNPDGDSSAKEADVVRSLSSLGKPMMNRVYLHLESMPGTPCRFTGAPLRSAVLFTRKGVRRHRKPMMNRVYLHLESMPGTPCRFTGAPLRSAVLFTRKGVRRHRKPMMNRVYLHLESMPGTPCRFTGAPLRSAVLFTRKGVRRHRKQMLSGVCLHLESMPGTPCRFTGAPLRSAVLFTRKGVRRHRKQMMPQVYLHLGRNKKEDSP